jgi:hypothetical protein
MTKPASHSGIVSSDTVESLVREIAQRSAAITRSRLHLDADQLSADELRGYVRARAIGPVRFLTRQLAGDGGTSIDHLERLTARALERTIHLVVRGMLSQPVVAATPAYVPLRAAA